MRRLDGAEAGGVRDEARRLLDAARAGADVSEELILLALMRSGDITRPSPDELACAARCVVWRAAA